jgi:hypothetical protein
LKDLIEIIIEQYHPQVEEFSSRLPALEDPPLAWPSLTLARLRPLPDFELPVVESGLRWGCFRLAAFRN